ncbi:hypothetical protein GW17_00017690 [Ensete ventricosum]|uniref:Uncharacterized protein n=1 Tax=Ensete ventricosum TaxID=4639 RepID=A0A427B3H7_ENSVE|nr:hypothetical protein B296_00012336 [Ensete ventricosum]RWW18328.1 hypothetical protein GW17_00017690 [Ensete ventricosum]RZS01548.1 hypothetical protein BHM03_00031415 [Ensete ventricosum]
MEDHGAATGVERVVLLGFCVAGIWSAYIYQGLWSRSSSGGAPLWSYWSPSITNTIGPSMGIEALKYISYPAQASFGKIYQDDSCIPEYICTFLVAGGVSSFALLKHPEAAWDILMYCLCGAVGQNFIFLTISRFGSLANTTITTTRKFVSIVVSSVISGNPLSPKQWSSVVMVFSGLSFQIFLKWRKLQGTKKDKKTA